ncbi:protein-L-isoaspartate O-methyltransferase-domain-containing protein, partial [Pelagophyceae sp. CCMP2097]
QLELRGAIRSSAVAAAFRVVDRSAYTPARYRGCAFDDMPLRLHDDEAGCVLHLSAPSIYAAALEALDLQKSLRLSLLNLGSGAGYFSALASKLVGDTAIHHCIEKCPKLTQRCRNTFANDGGLRHVRVHTASAFDLDFESSFLFDRIYCGAGARAADAMLFSRLLKPGGIMVGPFKFEPAEIGSTLGARVRSQALIKITRTRPGEAPLLHVDEFMAVQFTPLSRLRPPGSPRLELRGPEWGRDSPELFPPPFHAAVRLLARASAARPPAPAAHRLPWHVRVWEMNILTFLA